MNRKEYLSQSEKLPLFQKLLIIASAVECDIDNKQNLTLDCNGTVISGNWSSTGNQFRGWLK